MAIKKTVPVVTLRDLLSPTVQARQLVAFCKAAGLTYRTVTGLLDGRTKVATRRTIATLAAALGVSEQAVKDAIAAQQR